MSDFIQQLCEAALDADTATPAHIDALANRFLAEAKKAAEAVFSNPISPNTGSVDAALLALHFMGFNHANDQNKAFNDLAVAATFASKVMSGVSAAEGKAMTQLLHQLLSRLLQV